MSIARLSLLAALAACSPSAARRAPPQPAPDAQAAMSQRDAAAPAPAPAPVIAPGPRVTADGRVFAVVSSVMLVEECSGLGGEHYVFAADDPATAPPALFHAGGHGIRLGLLPAWGPQPTRWFVAELSNLPRASEDADGNPDSSVSGWCLDRLPRTVGSALRLLPANSRDDAYALLDTVTAVSVPREQAVLAAPSGATSISIVRVRQRTPGATGPFDVDVVDGQAPQSLTLIAERPLHHGLDAWFMPWTGDHVVVEVDARGVATRALIADDLADARRWTATIAQRGWPEEPITAGWVGAASVARWAAQGEVVAGNHACGPELRLDTWDGSRFGLEPRRVAAPSGANVGERVTAVVVGQPADRCGRTARVVRAWITPGTTGARWVAGGEPVPATARAL